MASRKIVSLKSTVKRGAPALPYEAIARTIFGSNYDLSLVICGDKLSRTINRQYRKKDYSPNVLSFPYSKHEGEIFLNVRKAAREARAGKVSHRSRIALLFVHGCFHLKGYLHGLTMERQEARVLRKFRLE